MIEVVTVGAMDSSPFSGNLDQSMKLWEGSILRFIQKSGSIPLPGPRCP